MQNKTKIFFYSLLTFLFLTYQALFSSEFIYVEGIIQDAETGAHLPYANIQVLDTKWGTTSNIDGKFSLVFEPETSLLKITYIGYKSRTIKIEQSTRNLIIKLSPIILKGKAVVVYGDRHTWLEKFILKAIDKKRQFKDSLLYYEAFAYSKTSFLFATSNDPFAIIEAISNIAYKAPDIYKEKVLNLKMPPYMKNVPYQALAINQNIDLYNERIKVKKFSIISPLNNDALNYYNYKLNEQLLFGQDTVISVTIKPKKSKKQLLAGELFFIKDTHQLIEAKLCGNNSVRDELADSLSLFIKYRVDSTFALPVFTKFKLLMDYMGMAYNYIQENSFVDYSLNNPKDRPHINLDRLISIEPNLTYNIDLKRDKVFKMPLSEKEQQHKETVERVFIKAPLYRRILLFLFTDLFPLSFDQPATIGKVKIEKFSNWYHFNKVEENFFGLEYQLLNNDIVSIYTQGGYSFGQKSLFYNIRSRYNGLIFQIKNHISNLGGFDYNKTTKTYSTLFSHQDKINYYHSRSYDLSNSYDFCSNFNTNLGVYFERQEPVKNTTNFSLFNRDRTFIPNYSIKEYSDNKFGIEFNYFENHDVINNRPIIYHGDSFFNISLSYYLQNKSLLKATENRSMIHFNLQRFQPIVYPMAINFKLIWHKQDRSNFLQESNFVSNINTSSVFERENDLGFFTLNDYDYYVNNYLKLNGDITLFYLPKIYIFQMSFGSIFSYLKPFQNSDYDTVYFSKLDKEFWEYGIVIKGISIFNLYVVTNNYVKKKFRFILRMNF